MNPVTQVATAALCGLILGDVIMGEQVNPLYVILAVTAILGSLATIASRSL